jgi:hypothetical protein
LEAPPTVGVLGPSSPTAPTVGTVGAASNVSRPYSGSFIVGAAQSPAASAVAICRGGRHQPPLLFTVGAVASPATPTVDARINSSNYILPSRDTLFYMKKG